MSSLGWLVVIIWTQIPGDQSHRTRARVAVSGAELEAVHS